MAIKNKLVYSLHADTPLLMFTFVFYGLVIAIQTFCLHFNINCQQLQYISELHSEICICNLSLEQETVVIVHL